RLNVKKAIFPTISATTMINILIADDHQMFIDGLRSLLEDAQDISVVAEARNGFDVLEQCAKHKVDIVIMDINMPEMDGVQATREVLKKYPTMKILGLSMYNDREYISDILKAGAMGYILKNTGKSSLLDAIYSLRGGSNYLGEEVTKPLLNGFLKNRQAAQAMEKLSDREKEVLSCIA